MKYFWLTVFVIYIVYVIYWMIRNRYIDAKYGNMKFPVWFNDLFVILSPILFPIGCILLVVERIKRKLV